MLTHLPLQTIRGGLAEISREQVQGLYIFQELESSCKSTCRAILGTFIQK